MKNLLSFLIVCLALTNCTERIDFDLNDDENKRLVVEGMITDELKKHWVRLTYTTSYYDSETPEPATGATVNITDGEQVWPLTEEPAGSGFYYTDVIAGTVGNEHTLNITLDGQDYEASDMMNPVSELEMIALGDDPEDEEEFIVYGWTADPGGVENFYRWNIFRNGVLLNDSLDDFAWNNDYLYDGTVLEAYEMWYLEHDEFNQGDTIVLEQMGITEMADEVYRAMNLETNWRGGLFDSAPANVQTNVTNGAVGFFTVASSSKAMAIYDL